MGEIAIVRHGVVFAQSVDGKVAGCIARSVCEDPQPVDEWHGAYSYC